MLKRLFKKEKIKTIHAPLSGKIIPLEDVPDPVFSQKMMGEGVAIQPHEGKVLSPVDGEVIQVIKTKHAIGLQTTDGVEVLIHIGLETVDLKGEGFNVHVATGDKVKVGQSLMEFDLEFIRKHAKSIITPVVITNSNEINQSFTVTNDQEVKAIESILITLSNQ